MIGGNNLTRRLTALEDKAAGTPQTVCTFVMPGEDPEAALTRRFGPAGPSQSAKVLIFTWQPPQDEPEQKAIS